MPKLKILNNESFNILKERGSAVPRDTGNYIITSFIIGKEYTVYNEDKSEYLRVRCTQNNPYHLKTSQSCS